MESRVTVNTNLSLIHISSSRWEAPKAPADPLTKPTNEKKGPEAPKAPADTSAKPADGKKGQEAPKAPADTPAKPTNEKKGQEEPKAPTDTSAKPADGKKSPVSDPSKPKDEKDVYKRQGQCSTFFSLSCPHFFYFRQPQFFTSSTAI